MNKDTEQTEEEMNKDTEQTKQKSVQKDNEQRKNTSRAKQNKKQKKTDAFVLLCALPPPKLQNPPASWLAVVGPTFGASNPPRPLPGQSCLKVLLRMEASLGRALRWKAPAAEIKRPPLDVPRWEAPP
jgi:hypothetical protein